MSKGKKRVTEAAPGRIDAVPERLITAVRLADLVQRVFAAAGSHPKEAHLIARHLVDANLVGHDSHGLVRVARYVDLARAGLVVPNQTAQVVTDRGANLLIDGQFGYGQVIGAQAMRSARAHTASRSSPCAILVIWDVSAPGRRRSPSMD